MTGPAPAARRRYAVASEPETTGMQIIRYARPLPQRQCGGRPPRTAAQRAFSWTVPVTQRHAVDRHHLEADLRSSIPQQMADAVRVLQQRGSQKPGHGRNDLLRQPRKLTLRTSPADRFSGSPTPGRLEDR